MTTTTTTTTTTTEDEEGRRQRRNTTHTHRASYVVSTSVSHAHVSKTANLHRAPSNADEVAASTLFHKRVLVCLCCNTRPFCFSYRLLRSCGPHKTLLCRIIPCTWFWNASARLASSQPWRLPSWMVLHIQRHKYVSSASPFFVALEMGISFAVGSLGKAGFIAIAQATASFALILTLLQLDFE
jgi:hypothetical protein